MKPTKPTALRSRSRTLLVTLASTLLVAACSGSGGSDGTDGGGTSALVLTSTGSGALFALEADLTRVELTREDGSTTENLLPATTSVEMAGLTGVAAWLADLQAGPGTYTSVALQFDPASVRAMSAGGADLEVDVPSGRCEIVLDRPLEIPNGTAAPLEVVVDLDESLQPAGPVWVFEPTGDAYPRDASAPERSLEQLTGLVVAASLPARTLQVRIYHDDAMTQPMGFVRVVVDGDSMLFDDDGTPFPAIQSLYGSLRLGLTVVEVVGTLQPDGAVLADRLEIEDQAGGGGRPPVVEIEGMVLHVFDDDPPFQGGEKFVMLIRVIEEGKEHAKDVLDSLGNPSSIDVLFSPQTRFRDPLGSGMAPEELRVGQIVDVTFEVFEGPPFEAIEVELESYDVHFTGFVHEVLPDTDEVVLRLDDDCWDRHEDDFDDDEYEHDSRLVTVDLSAADLRLQVRNEPEIRVDQLGVGMKLHVWGRLDSKDDDLDGEPDTPFIDARAATLRPGRLEGPVSETAPVVGAVRLSHYDVRKTFGEAVSGYGSIDVYFGDGVWFRGPIKSAGELYSAFDQLAPDEILELRIEGIVGDEPGEVLAYEAMAKRRHGNGNGNGHDDD